MPYCFLLYFTFRPQLPALHVIGSIWGAQWHLSFLLEVMPLGKHCRADMLLHKQKQLTQVTDKINKLCLRHLHSGKNSMRHPQIMTACRNLFMKSSMDRPTSLRVPNHCQHRFSSQSKWVIICDNRALTRQLYTAHSPLICHGCGFCISFSQRDLGCVIMNNMTLSL
mgnify:CR=1 FL=1